MSGQRWQRIEEVYNSALSLGGSERATFVAEVCAHDPILEREVLSLLKSDESTGDFLQTPVFELGLQVLMNDSLKSFDTTPVSAPGTDSFLNSTLDGRYWIEKELGHGGVGKVYLARDRKLHDKAVVVKILLEKSLSDQWVVQKFLQEKEALARVDHPGVVGILDTGELPDGKPYIVMQYVDGVSLREIIREQTEGLDLERAGSILRQIGAALSAVHAKGVFHRDLKPENIMLQRLDRGEQVKIVDFGIAKIKASAVAPSTITGAATAGTIVYMSPEQLHGKRVTAASDIYSFGVIAYEMMTGRRPFNPQTSAHLSDLQREGVRVKPIDLRPRLSLDAQTLVLKALAFEPQARHPNAGEFGDALAAALMNDEETLKQQRRSVSELPPTEYSIDPDLPGPATTPPRDKTMVTPFEPARPHTFIPPVPDVKPKSDRRRWPIVAGLLALLIVLSAGAYFVISKRQTLFSAAAKPDPVTALSQRSLVYSLTVQKMRDGKPYQEPFASSGREIFESGYKFRLNVSSPQSGYLYVFNEGADEGEGTVLSIIYPTPATNNGAANLDAGKSIQTNWNIFSGRAGTEQFWITWSAQPVAELESARDAAFKDKEGVVSDSATARRLKEFLSKHSEPKPETTKDTAKQETNVRANGDVLVKLVELEHR